MASVLLPWPGLGACLWFVAARLAASHDLNEAQVPGLLAFVAFLAAVAVAASAPVFPMLVRRIFIGIFVFFPTYCLCWLTCIVCVEGIYYGGRGAVPAWFHDSLLAASLAVAATAAIYLSDKA